jgi:hypothetical protein
MPLLTHPRWASPKPSASSTSEDAGTYPDLDLVPVYAIFWIVSAGRIVLAALRNETFGAETTLALLAVLFLPMLLLAPLRSRALSRQRRTNSTPADDQNVAPVLKVVTRESADRTTAHRPGRT